MEKLALASLVVLAANGPALAAESFRLNSAQMSAPRVNVMPSAGASLKLSALTALPPALVQPAALPAEAPALNSEAAPQASIARALTTMASGIKNDLAHNDAGSASTKINALFGERAAAGSTPSPTFAKDLGAAADISSFKPGEESGDEPGDISTKEGHLLYVVGRIEVGSSRVDLQACKLEYSIVSPK